ncbi:MAG: efflux RND transporter periplasmic adaptor subunit [Anaerolineales bacterium]|nr:efflux RND transporter periplasmic adaptor subunit [Anaerolineales bacterium]
MLRKKLFWALLIMILILVGGGYAYYSSRVASAGAAQTTEAAMQTAVARLGDLTIIASGTGSVVPASEIALGFDDSGTLIELNVVVGDKVKAGQTLARLQTKDTPESIQASIADAELAVIQAQNALNELYANAEIARTTALNDIATYAQEVRDAQYQLENYSVPAFLQNYDAIEALDLMKEQLDKAFQAFEPYRYYPQNDSTRRALLEALNLAQSNYDAAVKRLNYEYVLEVAQANLHKARQDYEKYKDGPAADELALAQAELANAQAKLALAKEAKAILELTAPSDGVILAVDANVGEVVSASPFITLANLEQPQIEVYLDETDLDKVAVGYEAEVVFDALPDKTFRGKVISVSPSLEEVSNVKAIKARVLLDPLEAGISLPVGLNAAVDIIAGRAENAVLVPIEALRELDAGEYGVFVVENGQPVLRVVQVGLMDITYAEIVSGVQAGEIVSTGIVETK